MPVWTEIARSSSPMVKRLHAWWLDHRQGANIPDRSALLPEHLAKLLPNILMTEIEMSPFRVRYRLVNVGFDFSGGYLDELEPVPAPVPWLDHYRTVVETRSPLLGSIEDKAAAGGSFTYEFGICPLRRGGSAVAQCISVEDYFGFQAKSAQWPR